MIAVFALRDGVLSPVPDPNAATLPADALWIDLLNPTNDEEVDVERQLGIDIPTRQETTTIEESARLYEARGTLIMTAIVVTGIAERRPTTAEVTFVLTPKTLVTVRYADPLPFRTFAAKCRRDPEAHDTSELVFLSLLENVVNRLGDVLESIHAQLDNLSDEIFDGNIVAPESVSRSLPARSSEVYHSRRSDPPTDLQGVVKRLGRSNSLISKLRESLLSVGRVLAYFRQGMGDRLRDGAKARLRTLDRNVSSLTDYDAQLSAEISFLLEATFGLISLEQNNIIKVFSIAAVLFLPPTLVGTIYGMNFQHMPELDWTLGYPLALLLMMASAIVPFWWFRRRGWL